jgi:uncharacterized membrane protein
MEGFADAKPLMVFVCIGIVAVRTLTSICQRDFGSFRGFASSLFCLLGCLESGRKIFPEIFVYFLVCGLFGIIDGMYRVTRERIFLWRPSGLGKDR